jgi:hypothetical protein
MKNMLLLILLILCGCNNEVETFKTDPKTTVLKFASGTGMITYKTVQIDGVEYYVSRTSGGNWVIGPKKEK